MLGSELCSERSGFDSRPYLALSKYFDLLQDPQRGLDMAQEVRRMSILCQNRTVQHRVNKQLVSYVLADIGRWQLQLKHYAGAEKTYQRVLAVRIVEFNDRSCPSRYLSSFGLWQRRGNRSIEQALECYSAGITNQERTQRSLLPGRHLPSVG